MSFVHGKSTKVFINEFDLTEYFNSADASADCDTAEVTTFGKNSKVYIAGLKDGTFSAEGFYDDSSDEVKEVLNEALGADNLVSVFYDTAAIGKRGNAANVINTSSSVSSTVDDGSNISVDGQVTGGRKSVISLHPMGEEDTAYLGTSVDLGASPGTSGATGYLHVTGATGTIATKIQHSSDDFVSDVEDLITFTNVTGATSEKVDSTITTIKQYVRAFADASAGGEDITFNMSIHIK